AVGVLAVRLLAVVAPPVADEVGVGEVNAAVHDGDDRRGRAGGLLPRTRGTDIDAWNAARLARVLERPLLAETRVVRRDLLVPDEEVRLDELHLGPAAQLLGEGLRVLIGAELQLLKAGVAPELTLAARAVAAGDIVFALLGEVGAEAHDQLAVAPRGFRLRLSYSRAGSRLPRAVRCGS